MAGIELAMASIPTPMLGVNGNGTLTGIGSCPTGKRVISGGHNVSFAGSGNLVVQSSYADSLVSWRVSLKNTSISAVSGITFNIVLVCADM